MKACIEICLVKSPRGAFLIVLANVAVRKLKNLWGRLYYPLTDEKARRNVYQKAPRRTSKQVFKFVHMLLLVTNLVETKFVPAKGAHKTKFSFETKIVFV